MIGSVIAFNSLLLSHFLALTLPLLIAIMILRLRLINLRLLRPRTTRCCYFVAVHLYCRRRLGWLWLLLVHHCKVRREYTERLVWTLEHMTEAEWHRLCASCFYPAGVIFIRVRTRKPARLRWNAIWCHFAIRWLHFKFVLNRLESLERGRSTWPCHTLVAAVRDKRRRENRLAGVLAFLALPIIKLNCNVLTLLRQLAVLIRRRCYRCF